MFTGIIEEIGEVLSIENGEKSSTILIKAGEILKGTRLGDSISTNGVCLTVTNLYKDSFKANVMAETLRRSNLGGLKIGSKVNLERALTLDKRLGGHIVSGHIDGVGTIIDLKKEDISTWFSIKIEKELLKYIVEKGSVAIDGISLTVAYVDREKFKVSIIPHTGENTILLTKKLGDSVNIECDIMGKYIEKLLRQDDINNENKTIIDEKFLMNNGFM